jgi:hypothetical protein
VDWGCLPLTPRPVTALRGEKFHCAGSGGARS